MSHSYDTIAAAIRYISSNVRKQPTLEEIAAHVHLSPFHFQRLFTEWAGVSPKKFLQFLTVGYAKQILANRPQLSLFDTADEAGLSGTGRLHDLFVSIEGMTHGEYRDGGKNLDVFFSISECRFGRYIIASTDKGVCNLFFFEESIEHAIEQIRTQWSGARLINHVHPHHQKIYTFFETGTLPGRMPLHLKATGFQLKVWEALLNIPAGALSTYGNIAQSIGAPGASRAVGSAVACNTVAYLIPCHRVIRNEGIFGHFRWGAERKTVMIGWEAAKISLEGSMETGYIN